MSKTQIAIITVLSLVAGAVICTGVATTFIVFQSSQRPASPGPAQAETPRPPLPTETPRPTFTPVPTAAGAYIKIADDWTCRDDSIGNTIFQGRVSNTSPDNGVAAVRLRVSVTENDRVINTTTGFVDSDIIYPAGESSFTIYLDNPGARGDGCEVSVIAATWRK